jgi:hypothetical protein
VIEREPAASVEVVNVAWPETFSVPVPRLVAPSRKVTVPVGVPAPGAFTVTVAVSVTACPNTEGFAEEATVVAVDALFTVSLDAADVLVLKLLSPPYTAVIEWVPTASRAVVNVAWRAAFTVPVPRVVVPSKKVTVPVGVPAPGALAVTVAVNVTARPKTELVGEAAVVVVVEAVFTVSVSAADVLAPKFPLAL